MQLSFQHETMTINFEVIYRKRKTMTISVEPPDKITVIVPQGTKEELILDKVKANSSWIIKKLQYFGSIHYPQKREYKNGESFMYRGKNYSLYLNVDKTLNKISVKLYQGKFMVSTPTTNKEVLRKSMEEWYRHKALEKIKESLPYYQAKVDRIPTHIYIKDQKRRWGSCSSKGNLNFNWRLIMAPPRVMDYIIVHEICHMVHLNHSREFWDLVSSIMPDYKEQKEWLKINAMSLNL